MFVKNTNQPIAETQQVTLLAIVRNGKATLLDADGAVVRRGMLVKRLRHPANPDLAKPCIWNMAINLMIARLERRTEWRAGSPWKRKAENLACSFRLRAKDLQRPRSRSRFSKYPTTNWKAAGNRMWNQADSRNRRHRDSGWARWSRTTSNNNNKRKGARYG